MARQRNEPTGGTGMAVGVEELSQDQINALLASTRQRGEYDRQILNFFDGTSLGVEISLTEGPFQGKKPASVVTGFKGALDRINSGKIEGLSDEVKNAARNTRVINHEDRVYLVRQAQQEEAA